MLRRDFTSFIERSFYELRPGQVTPRTTQTQTGVKAMAQSVSPQEHPITVGIIGSGAIGTAFARTLAGAGSKAGRERKV